jgi:hypothetical protein
MAFELGMVALLAVLPRESWFFAKAFNFMQFSHLPFIWLLSMAGPESMAGGIIALLLMEAAMTLIWACLLVWGGALLCFGLARVGGVQPPKTSARMERRRSLRGGPGVRGSGRVG